MISPAEYTPDRAFVHGAVNELFELHEGEFEPTTDIDLVWAISSLGTVKQKANPGPSNPYDGGLWNLDIVNDAVQIIIGVTALRLGKPKEDITKEDIKAVGPKLLYNGEDIGSPGNYPMQNEHFKEITEEPDFPIPPSNIVIGHIKDANTPGQVSQVAEYVESERDRIRKIAVVCGLPHAIRVGRYIEHLKELFPEDTGFVVAPVTQGDDNRQMEIALVELRKARYYREIGDLAHESTFFPDGAKERLLKKPW